MVPALAEVGINAIYAGLRPATEHKDYVIEALPQQNWITVAWHPLDGAHGFAWHRPACGEIVAANTSVRCRRKSPRRSGRRYPISPNT